MHESLRKLSKSCSRASYESARDTYSRWVSHQELWQEEVFGLGAVSRFDPDRQFCPDLEEALDKETTGRRTMGLPHAGVPALCRQKEITRPFAKSQFHRRRDWDGEAIQWATQHPIAFLHISSSSGCIGNSIFARVI